VQLKPVLVRTPLLGLALVLGLGLASCRLRHDAHNAPGKYAAGTSYECQSGYTTADGPYRYENNQWGSDKARGRFEQCLLKRSVNGKQERGWTWNFPGTDPSVFSYPEIVYGWKPWTGGNTTDPHLPVRVSDVRHLAIVYEVESQITGSYNLAPEIWLINRNVKRGQAAPSAITAEIMFWMDAGGAAQPGGSIVSRPTIDGVVYELWKLNGAGNKGNGSGWTLISFKSPTPQLKGTINIESFLRQLVADNLINPEHYVASIEFGNEVSGGRGTTWVKHFEVEARP
jgi:Glycosyl hydrolase family 12